jgi:hypothetical protein
MTELNPTRIAGAMFDGAREYTRANEALPSWVCVGAHTDPSDLTFDNFGVNLRCLDGVLVLAVSAPMGWKELRTATPCIPQTRREVLEAIQADIAAQLAIIALETP